MLLEFRYDREKNILYGRYEGRFSIEEFESKLIEIVSGTDYPADVPTIWDLGQMDAAQFNWEFMAELIAIRKKYPERGEALIAIVAPTDLTFGVSRMYTAIADSLPPTMQVFRDIEQAESWLQTLPR